MATSTAQRTGIWIIAVVLTVGTLAGFIAMILAPQNEKTDAARLQASYAEYQKATDEYQKKLQAQADKYSAIYYAGFSQYSTIPAAFTAGDVKTLASRDIVVGSGEEIKQGTAYSAYYIGWNPKGKVFDQSIESGKLKSPIAGGDQIVGWNEGVVGMKIGGVRELTIPSDKAYGPTERSADIPANTPLKFIVMAIPKVEEIKQPEVPKELLQNYGG